MRREIMRLNQVITGTEIWAERSIIKRVEGAGEGFRRQRAAFVARTLALH